MLTRLLAPTTHRAGTVLAWLHAPTTHRAGTVLTRLLAITTHRADTSGTMLTRLHVPTTHRADTTLVRSRVTTWVGAVKGKQSVGGFLATFRFTTRVPWGVLAANQTNPT